MERPHLHDLVNNYDMVHFELSMSHFHSLCAAVLWIGISGCGPCRGYVQSANSEYCTSQHVDPKRNEETKKKRKRRNGHKGQENFSPTAHPSHDNLRGQGESLGCGRTESKIVDALIKSVDPLTARMVPLGLSLGPTVPANYAINLMESGAPTTSTCNV